MTISVRTTVRKHANCRELPPFFWKKQTLWLLPILLRRCPVGAADRGGSRVSSLAPFIYTIVLARMSS